MGNYMRNKEEAKAKDRGPRVVIDGVVVKNGGEKDKPSTSREPRGAFVLFFFALIFVGILILASGFFASCASTAAIKADGALRLDIKTEVPATLAAKLRSLSGKDSGARLFDEASLRHSIESRSDFKILALAAPGSDSFSASLSVPNLAGALAESELSKKGIVRLSKGAGWTELSIRLARGQGRTALDLFPGVDEELIDALSPPALDEDPVSQAEYRTMLSSLIGSKAMKTLDASELSLDISAPETITESEGGQISGKTLKVRIPLLDLLCLEKPILIRLRYRS
jgi:hypothetical protein